MHIATYIPVTHGLTFVFLFAFMIYVMGAAWPTGSRFQGLQNTLRTARPTGSLRVCIVGVVYQVVSVAYRLAHPLFKIEMALFITSYRHRLLFGVGAVWLAKAQDPSERFANCATSMFAM